LKNGKTCKTGNENKTLKCPKCGHWNRFEIEKVLFNPDNPELKVRVFLPSYLPLKTEKCEKCKKIIVQPNELIRIVLREYEKT
jgi:phage FluMu protein Com